MTLAPSASAPPRGAPRLPGPRAAALLGCLVVLALTAGRSAAVWSTGTFVDPDDAMRAVEVRDLLAGQGWYDLVQHRLAPGHGVPMHWSRLADLPVAALVLPLRALLAPDRAEWLARLVEPVLLLAGFMLCAARLGRALLGAPGPLAACLLAACGLDTAAVFMPGHIHHHALQVALLMVLALLVVEGVGEERARAARFALAGAVAAVTLAVNLQNLPFVAAAAAVLGCAWVARGEPFTQALRGFAAALTAGAGAVFLVQVPPDRYAAATCDAFGAPHLLAALLGGVGLLGLAAASPLLPSPARRCVAAAAAGVAAELALRAAYPACLGDPYAGVDPVLRARWLADVGEALPLGALLRRDPAGGWPIAAALLLGGACLAAAAARSAGADRARWAAVAAFGAVGAAGTLWEVRVAASAEPFAALGAAWGLCRLFDPARPRRPLAAPCCAALGLALTQAGWAAAAPLALAGAAPAAPAGRPRVDAYACYAPAAYAALAALPPGLVMSTIDPGSQILAYTSHSVLAAPYHRNGFGNLAALRFFDAPEGEARAMAVGLGVRYVAVCLSSPEVIEDAARAPDGVAAAVLRGAPPPWLEPVPGGETGAVRVFAPRGRGPSELFWPAPDTIR